MTDHDDLWLSQDPLPADPMPILLEWLNQAFAAGEQPNPHAMALATANAAGVPSVRTVLCKAVEPSPGGVVFYTHRDSAKGRELEARPVAEACFVFGPQGRQARVAGPVALTDDQESDAYFASRPLDSQLGAWASSQSEPLESRAVLEARIQEMADRFGVASRGEAPSDKIPRPPNWGGFRILAERVELWHSRPARIHDRAVWTRPAPDTRHPWTSQRLHP